MGDQGMPIRPSTEHDGDETMRASTEEVVRGVIGSIDGALDALPDSPRVRELRMTAKTYERALETWQRSPPSNEQERALRELAFELQSEVEALDDPGADAPALGPTDSAKSPSPLRSVLGRLRRTT